MTKRTKVQLFFNFFIFFDFFLAEKLYSCPFIDILCNFTVFYMDGYMDNIALFILSMYSCKQFS